MGLRPILNLAQEYRHFDFKMAATLVLIFLYSWFKCEYNCDSNVYYDCLRANGILIHILKMVYQVEFKMAANYAWFIYFQ